MLKPYLYETHLHTSPVSRCARFGVRENLEYYKEILAKLNLLPEECVMVGNDVAILYGDAVVKYQSMELKAEYIRLSLDSNIVYASGVVDSTGNYVGTPVFKDGSEVIESSSMKYNIKTKKR